jgi:CRP/FNR family transcriptional regulator, cyclic AMP receptor protein
MNGSMAATDAGRIKLAYLKEIDIFQDLTPDEITALGQHTPMKRVPAGTVLHAPDQPTEVLFILKEGRVRLYHLLADGRKLTTALLDAGVIFGEMALLGQDMDSSFAETVSDCVLCLMSRHDVKTLLLGDSRIAFRIAETMGRRLIESERRLLDIAFKRVPERLAILLLQLARRPAIRFMSATRPEVACTHEELADMAGTSRETVTKVLNDFRSRHLIELERGRIILLDTEGLRQVAGPRA